MEALSYGVPCVANCLGGIPEIIQDGYNGILTEETSSEGLTIAIKKLLDCVRMAQSNDIVKMQKKQL